MTAGPKYATKFAELRPLHRIRTLVRNGLVGLEAWRARLPLADEWVFFPFYHHVLDDERRGFERHLKFCSQHGDFASLDQALERLRDPQGIGGRFFCLTFDDGYKNVLTNALPILLDHAAPCAVFLTTDFISLDAVRDWERVRDFPYGYRRPLEFLAWDDCRQLRDAGVTIGSHTCTHPRLRDLAAATVERELIESKRAIESQLQIACRHFACPYGGFPGDFDPDLHPQLARQAGYESFLTTMPGLNYAQSSPWAIRRNHYVGCHSTSYLRRDLAKRQI